MLGATIAANDIEIGSLGSLHRRPAGIACAPNAQSSNASANEVDVATQKEENEDKPPPVPASNEYLLICRLLRVVASASIPGCGFLALPAMLDIRRAGDFRVCSNRRRTKYDICKRHVNNEPGDEEMLFWILAAWSSTCFLYHFAACSFRDPGYVMEQDITDRDGRFAVVWPPRWASSEMTLWYTPKWCKTCEQWKPARAHHSTTIGKCIHRMDHYCPVTENAIGSGNHGHFVLMIIHAHIGLVYALYMCVVTTMPVYSALLMEDDVSRFVIHGKRYVLQNLIFLRDPLLQILGWEIPALSVLSVIALFTVFRLLINHVRMALKGITVIEEGKWTDKKGQSGETIDLPDGTKYLLPLYAWTRGGRLQNLKTLLGPSWWLPLLAPAPADMAPADILHPMLSDSAAMELAKRVRGVA